MTETQSRSSEVTVGVDPHIAFTAFTEEMDLWWVRGPINFYDSSRAVAVRCEPGVGGRLLEVYDDARGDWLELGRITIWEPGRSHRLAELHRRRADRGAIRAHLDGHRRACGCDRPR